MCDKKIGDKNKTLVKLSELTDVLSYWVGLGGVADLVADTFQVGLANNGRGAAAAGAGAVVVIPPQGVFFGAYGATVTAKAEAAYLITGAIGLKLASFGLAALA